MPGKQTRHLRSLTLKHAIFLLLSFVTIQAYSLVDKYQEVGGQLLANNNFSDGLQGWLVGGSTSAEVLADAGFVRLKLQDGKSSVDLSQSLPQVLSGEKFVFRGAVKTVGIEGGKKAWEKGRVILAQYVDGKAVHIAPNLLVALDGTHDWAEHSIITSIQPRASDVKVRLQLNYCTGELQVKGLELFRLQENPVYRVVRWVVLGTWALFLLSVFVPGLIGSCRGKRWSALLVLVLVVIIFGTTAPGTVKNEAKNGIVSHAKTYANEIVEYGGSAFVGLKWPSIDIAKVAHFLLFAMLSGLLYAQRRRGAVWLTLIDIGMLACGSELMQLFIDGRRGLFTDVVIDMAGGGIGVLISWKLKIGSSSFLDNSKMRNV